MLRTRAKQWIKVSPTDARFAHYSKEEFHFREASRHILLNHVYLSRSVCADNLTLCTRRGRSGASGGWRFWGAGCGKIHTDGGLSGQKGFADFDVA